MGDQAVGEEVVRALDFDVVDRLRRQAFDVRDALEDHAVLVIDDGEELTRPQLGHAHPAPAPDRERLPRKAHAIISLKPVDITRRRHTPEEPMRRIALHKYIVADSEICHGKPTFKGTRIMVWQILEMLTEGADIKKIREAFPRLTAKQIQRASTDGGSQWTR